jgi:DNA-binding response OmpR family regulator
MTPEEIKRYVERQLGELGCTVHIGKAGFERIFHFTEGTEDGTKQLCHKLISLGALQENQEINDDVLQMAMTDLTRIDDMAPPPQAARTANPEMDLVSIEQLAAVLEAKVANREAERELRFSPAVGHGGNGARARPAAAPLPKILVVDASAAARTMYAKVLANNFLVMEAPDGEQAWKALIEQADIELVVTDLAMPNTDGYELIKRIRTALSPPHLVGVPIIVVTRPEAASAKLRALMVGADDFILKNAAPDELRARVLARHRLSKTAARVSSNALPRTVETSARIFTPRSQETKRKAQPARAGQTAAPAPKAVPPKEASVVAFSVERRIPPGKGATPALGLAASRESFVKQLYRISSTTTITLSATALLALAIIVIIYTGRPTSRMEISQMTKPPLAGEPSSSETHGSAGSSSGPTPRNEPLRDEPVPETARPTAPVALIPSASLPAPPSTDIERLSKPKSEPNSARSAGVDARAGEKLQAARSSGATPKSAKPDSIESVPKVPQPTLPPSETPAPPMRPAPPPSVGANVGREPTATAERPLAASAPAPSAPPVNRISRDELASFLRRFVSIYEAGDLDQFLGLFADNARTNDRTGRKGIREDYDTLFRATDLRQMKLGEISWEIEGNQAYGWGDFDVTVRRLNDQETYVYTGSMTFVLEKNDGRLRVVRLYHGQRRADTG